MFRKKEKILRGFTLVELLIAVSIFSIIAICLYTTFSSGIHLWRRQETGFRYGHGVRLALDMVAKDLKNVIPYSHESPEEVPVPGTEQEMPVFTGESDTVSFMTLISGDIAKVSYFFERDLEQGGVLKRTRVFQEEGFQEEHQKEDILVADLDKVAFEYAYRTEEEDAQPNWLESWEDGSVVPQGVRITLEFSGDGDEGKILKKTVFIPAGALGEQG